MNLNSEDQSVQKPALKILRELGWECVDAMPEWNTATPSVTGRDTFDEAVLKDRLDSAIRRLNPNLTDEQVIQAIDEVVRDRSMLSLVEANRAMYRFLKDGVKVDARNEQGDLLPQDVRLIAWEKDEISLNDFVAIEEYTVLGGLYKRRADVVLFVNGLPLVNIEFKAGQIDAKKAFDDNITAYLSDIPQLYWYNALTVASNGSKAQFGTITSQWEHYYDWKRIDHEQDKPKSGTETLLRGMFEPARLLDIIENFTLFQMTENGTIKLVSRNHQYLGVNKTIKHLLTPKEDERKLGVFWHTQGSGKSLSMVFFAQKVLRKLPGNWSFVIVTDRLDLDRQIYGNFANTGAVTEDEKEVRAASAAVLREQLGDDHRYLFTLIQKFQSAQGQPMPALSDRDDIIVMTDEAHRSQYAELALNMRTALPNARYLGFTGTPLIGKEAEVTKEVFGDYVSVYDFGQAVIDKATVPLFYDNGIPRLHLQNEQFSQEMEEIAENADLNDEQQELLERKFAQAYHLIIAPDRLDDVAKDLVDNFASRGFRGKAYYVGIDKRAAVHMYDLVQKHWQAKIEHLTEMRDHAEGDAVHKLTELIDYMASSDMAVIVSQSQNEIAQLQKHGLDITPHRHRMVTEDLEKKFKKSDDPLRLVFVCSMWITGFDAPSVSTVYLDKPMRNHTLMQTIARANRIFKDKPSGTIVDYIGVFRSLHRALSIYGSVGDGGDVPVRPKDAIIADLCTALDEMNSYCNQLGFDLERVLATPTDNFVRASVIADCVELILCSEATKSEFTRRAHIIRQLFSAILPDIRANEFIGRNHLINALLRGVHSDDSGANIDDVLEQVGELVNRSISVSERYEEIHESELVDLSKLDLSGLRQQFDKGRQHATIEEVVHRLDEEVTTLVRKNRTRGQYQEKLQRLIDEYNSGVTSLEEIMQMLESFKSELTHESERHVREGLSEEELALYDQIGQVAPSKNKDSLKLTAKDLMSKLKQALSLDWRKSQRNRALVKKTIRDELRSLETEDQELQDLLYEHVYESYQDSHTNIYS